MFSVYDTAKRLLPDGAAFDCALPQDWVYEFTELVGVTPVGRFVWVYDAAAPIFGRPFPLDPQAKMALADYNQIAGTEYPTERD